MPEIEITDDQHERLRAVQEALEADVVGKYGHVRVSDAVEYLLDRYEADEADASVADGSNDGTANGGTADGTDDSEAEGGSDGDGGATDDGGTVTGDDDAELDAMMNLLDEHGDRWRESSASDARYEVELPDGTTEHARTKDDVRGLLFRHYR
ncbi:MAG: hypothetical protein ABEH78_00875 [Haloferacaceae archaeon]